MSNMIDDAVEKERERRRNFIQRIRKENDEAPRPTIGAVELMQARERLREREAAGVEDEDHHWAGTRASDMTETARADVMTEARRNVGANVEREGDGDELIYEHLRRIVSLMQRRQRALNMIGRRGLRRGFNKSAR